MSNILRKIGLFFTGILFSLIFISECILLLNALVYISSVFGSRFLLELLSFHNLNQVIILGTFYLIVYVVAFVIVFRSIIKKNYLYQIFKYSRKKLLLTSLYIGLIILVFIYNDFTYIKFKNINYYPFPEKVQATTRDLISYILLSAFMFYPFAAVTTFIFENFKSLLKKKSIKKIMLLIFLLLVTNPLFQIASVIGTAIIEDEQINKFADLRPCGALVTNVLADSPAEKAGIKRTEIIKKIDDQQVFSHTEVLTILNKLDQHKTLVISTNMGSYTVIPERDIETNKFRIGVTLARGRCPTWQLEQNN